MILKLLRRVFGSAAPSQTILQGDVAAGIEISREVHGVSREQLSSAARRVCVGLQEAGYKAYVVGGAVRDLLLGRIPKDFDIATNATPEQVRDCFRRARIIGRRFQIVHVTHGQEIIEVTTFRAAESKDTAIDEHGRILHDNVWGSIAEDASRRDFTANALYFDPSTEVIVDYHNGVEDIRNHTLRMIGEPTKRYREDPVRMLRAVRLAAKLGLHISPETQEPIKRMADLLGNVPAARLFDEILKLLVSGHAVVCLKRLRAEGLHSGLLPLLDVILEQPLGERFVWLSLENTDKRVQEGKPISPGFLFATLLWHEVLANWQNRKQQGEVPTPALFAAMHEVLEIQADKLAITRRITGDIKDIWALQPRFEKRAGRMPYRLLEQQRFRAGYDFLRLRALSGEIPLELANWWEQFAHASEETRAAMLLPAEGPARKRRQRSKKPRSPDIKANAMTDPHGEA